MSDVTVYPQSPAIIEVTSSPKATVEVSGLPFYSGSSDSANIALQNHINSPTPHPVYDDMPSLTLIYQNGLI